jgi:porin
MAISQYHKTNQIIFALLMLVCLLALCVTAFSQESTTAPTQPTTNIFTQKWFLGDWGGYRTRLEEQKGIKFDFFYVSDMLYAKDGRYRDGGAAWNRVRGTMDIDLGKLAGLDGLTFHVTGLWQGGPNLGANYLGSISNPSGLVSARTEILDSYWLAYAMAGGKVTLRFGQFASMDYYGLQPYGGQYLMEPLNYGFQNRFNDYASFDPASGPGVQLVVNPYHFLYYTMAYTSGNRNPYFDDYNGFHYVKKDSGVLSDSVGIKIDQPGTGKLAKEKYYPGQYEVGSTYNGGRFTNPFNPVPLYLSQDTGNYVYYFMGNQAVFRPKTNSDTGLDVLFGISVSPNTSYNFVDKNVTAGFAYHGLIPQRRKDSVNFALSYTHVSDKYAAAFALANPTAPPYSSEKAYEFNYLFRATPYWIIQPTVQWYQDVGGFSKYGTGFAGGLRTKVTF